MIDIYVRKAETTAANLETLTAGMVNAVTVRFNLSAEWTGLAITAVFTNGITTVDVLQEHWLTENTCAIPHEVLALPHRNVRVGLQGRRGNELVLPAVMCSLGKTLPGADPSDDPSVDPALPVYEQLRQTVSELPKSYAVRLQKNPHGQTAQGTLVRICFDDASTFPGGVSLHLYRCLRRKSRRYSWVHPANWSEQGENMARFGYGLIAQTPYACTNTADTLLYPPVPDWMPNNGYLQTEFPLNEENLQNGFYELSIGSFLLPLLKPTDKALGWNDMGFIGLGGSGLKAPLLFQFRLVADGRILSRIHDTLCIGMHRGNRAEGIGRFLDIQTPCLKTSCLYTAIR
ncbi:MAG: hypothetical protein Q4C04_03750 [Clostridia bacterium]|nr:hypothetical protein [Clostridia bacterium]